MSDPQRFSIDIIDAARQQQTEQAVHGTEFFLQLAYLGAAIKSAAPRLPGVATITHYTTGFHLSGPPRFQLPRPGPAIILYLAPAPLGVLPPEAHGLSPDYLKSVLPDFLKFEALAGSASPQRLEVFAIEERNRAIGKRVDRFVIFGKGEYSTPELLDDLAFLRALPEGFEGTVIGTPASQLYAEAIERELSKRGYDVTFNAAARAIVLQVGQGAVAGIQQAVSTPPPQIPVAIPQPNAAPVPQVDFGINVPSPITLLALGIQAAATGLARELITEANDP